MAITSGSTILASDMVGIKMFRGYAADAGSTDAYAITVSPTPASYVTGDMYIFKANTLNTGAATLNVNSLGAIAIKKTGTVNLESGDIEAGQFVVVVYDGTNFQMVNSIRKKFAAGQASKDTSVTTTTTIAHGLGVIPKIVRLSALFSGLGGAQGIGGAVAVVTQSNTYAAYNFAATATPDNVYGSDFRMNANSTNYLLASSITIDATNITITWSLTGTPNGTVNINWEAEA